MDLSIAHKMITIVLIDNSRGGRISYSWCLVHHILLYDAICHVLPYRGLWWWKLQKTGTNTQGIVRVFSSNLLTPPVTDYRQRLHIFLFVFAARRERERVPPWCFVFLLRIRGFYLRFSDTQIDFLLTKLQCGQNFKCWK